MRRNEVFYRGSLRNRHFFKLQHLYKLNLWWESWTTFIKVESVARNVLSKEMKIDKLFVFMDHECLDVYEEVPGLKPGRAPRNSFDEWYCTWNNSLSIWKIVRRLKLFPSHQKIQFHNTTTPSSCPPPSFYALPLARSHRVSSEIMPFAPGLPAAPAPSTLLHPWSRQPGLPTASALQLLANLMHTLKRASKNSLLGMSRANGRGRRSPVGDVWDGWKGTTGHHASKRESD